MNPDQAAEWSQRYREGKTGWDLGMPAPNLQRLIGEWVKPPARIIVPGMGRGHDAVALAQAGYQVTGVDFAPEAIAAAEAKAKQVGTDAAFLCGDLFQLTPETHGLFDAWAELTCFCAISPGRRPEYVRQAARMLEPGGLLIGVFFVGLPEGGPPFDSTVGELESLFSTDFEKLKLALSKDSVPGRFGLEWEGVFRRL